MDAGQLAWNDERKLVKISRSRQGVAGDQVNLVKPAGHALKAANWKR